MRGAQVAFALFRYRVITLIYYFIPFDFAIERFSKILRVFSSGFVRVDGARIPACPRLARRRRTIWLFARKKGAAFAAPFGVFLPVSACDYRSFFQVSWVPYLV